MVPSEKLLTAMNPSLQKKVQIPTCIHDLGCNFRGSNMLPEVTDRRSRAADLVHPLCFADEDRSGERTVEAFPESRPDLSKGRLILEKEFSVVYTSKLSI